MAKRGKFSFTGSSNIFRISMPGVDVDTATDAQLLVSEQFLTSQVTEQGYVANPSPGTASATYAVEVPILDRGYEPFVQHFPVLSNLADRIAVCSMVYESSTALSYTATSYAIAYNNRVIMVFRNGLNGSFVRGMYYFVSRKPWNA